MSTLQDIARSRKVRVSLAVVLIATGAMGFVPYVFNDISTQAAINAPLIRLTATADGTVAELPPSGRYFARPTEIKLLDLSQDTGEVADLKAQAEFAAAQMDLAKRQLAELDGQRTHLVQRAALFTGATSASLGDARDTLVAELRGCEADRAAQFAARERARSLAAQGFISAAGVEKAEAAAELTANSCKSTAARLHAVDVKRGAANAGVFIGDSYNDAPYAVQQSDRLLLQRQVVEKTLSDATAQYSQARLRLRDALARASYRAPAGTLIWSQNSSSGAAIRAGEPVLDLVDCRRRFVQVALPERKAETIRPGTQANVRLIGGSDWVQGEVVNIMGGAGRKETALLAADPAAASGEREISIQVALPRQDADKLSAGRKCDVGRLAEVRFSRSF
ncbi:MAG: HlyD family efflux transporter periplasmic adaptor subunit [Sphingomonadales bacterium]|nr:HlyD family efflux transporter periplasmic adaptor subunit [Sphingomonadales bacterium]